MTQLEKDWSLGSEKPEGMSEELSSRVDALKDFKNHYLHLIITSSKDECSKAKLDDLHRMN